MLCIIFIFTCIAVEIGTLGTTVKFETKLNQMFPFREIQMKCSLRNDVLFCSGLSVFILMGHQPDYSPSNEHISSSCPMPACTPIPMENNMISHGMSSSSAGPGQV